MVGLINLNLSFEFKRLVWRAFLYYLIVSDKRVLFIALSMFEKILSDKKMKPLLLQEKI